MWNFSKPKSNLFCCLDIGTESVKALIFNIEKDSKNQKKALILGWGVSYFDKFDIQGAGDFNRQILEKSITQAISSAKNNSFFSSTDREIKKAIIEQKKWQVVVGLSPLVFKARVENIFYRREKQKVKIGASEGKNIYRIIFKEAKKKFELNYSNETGILGADIYWNSCDIIDFKIDGYSVEKIIGYKGKDLKLKVLATFLPKDYYNRFSKILSGLNMEVLKFIHISEGINKLSKETLGDGFYLDIGGDATQIIAVTKGKIEKVSEFERGVSNFVENISLLFGIDKFSSYEMVRNYCEGTLEQKSVIRLREIFVSEKLNWYEDLKADLKKMPAENIFPAVFWFFGGGSLMPEFSAILQEKGGKDLDKILFLDFINISQFDPQNLELLEYKTKDLNNAQFMSSLLMCYNFIKG